ncbi:Lactoylglutathione lyase / glyoxalase I family protein [Euphorbia peplus]|nr:Lactoylglutathione lyase / glyoxalase I family protein [Euphorbia peplus]
MEVVMSNLEEKSIEYVTAVVQEGGITVDQLFFHDPDGYMVEICNCQNLPVLPLSSSSCPLKLPTPTIVQSQPLSFYGKMRSWEVACSGGVASLMMDNLLVGIMDISI